MESFTPSELADICDRAADEILIRGGHTGAMMHENGSVCVNGALVFALGREDRLYRDYYPCGEYFYFYEPPTDDSGHYLDDTSALEVGPPEIHAAMKKRLDGETAWHWNDKLGLGPAADGQRIELLRCAAKDLRESA